LTATSSGAPRLGRRIRPLATAPIRIVHLGLGAFHRAHQAFYTDRVDAEREWGIAAFTGRRPDLALRLAAQDGLYTLIERADAGDSFSTISSIVEAVDGTDLARFAQLVAAPTTSIVTLTVTEAAYRAPAGSITSVPGRLVFALNARRRADGGLIALVPCDNLADNAGVLRAAVTDIAATLDPGLARWITEHVSFVGTSVDRITPATTQRDISLVERECGYRDEAPVVTEPFHDWVLSGDFPAGRPAWETAGALFVADIRPYETRKLRFLNGAHSLLAYVGQLRGYTTVAEAIADDECRSDVDAFWDLAQSQLDEPALRLDEYRQELMHRFANRSIGHQLRQIAVDGSIKLRNRVVPVVQAAGADGGVPALRIIAAWIEYLSTLGQVGTAIDPAAPEINDALALSGLVQSRALLTLLEPTWSANDELTTAVHALRRTLNRGRNTS
jgi:fructuronate reductase